MTAFDIAALGNLMRMVAQAEILPRFRRLGDGDVRTKTDVTDVVTEADEAAERAIKARLDSVLPGALFVGEESVAKTPALLGALASADLALVVDPIDGTYNFAAGLPLFAVMAAVVKGGETIAGVIYDPMGDDWVLAEKGAGAWQVRPDGHRTRLKAMPAAPLSEMFGAASSGFLTPDERGRVLGNMAKIRFLMAYRCAGHEYRTYAAGHMHFLMYQKLMPWDHLPGSLIAAEAGAYVRRLDGSIYAPHHTDGGLLVAADRDAWQALRNEVFTL